MRQDCKHFESRSYPNGDTVRKCNLDLAPEAPWRCPEDCSGYTRRLADVNWSYGSLVTPATPAEPESVGEDDSVAALLDAAEDIINQAAPDVIADLDAERAKRERKGLGRLRKGGTAKKKKKGKGGGLGERFRRRYRDGQS